MIAMACEPVIIPSRLASQGVLADWLELVAFFNEYGVARLDVLSASMKKLYEYEEYDADDGGTSRLDDSDARNVGNEDSENEKFRESIENEIDLRISTCPESYPFELSHDAEELQVVEDWVSEKHATYLACLIASHFPNDGLLDIAQESSQVKQFRNRIFQIISAHALCGYVNGQAASIGWPREDGKTIIETLKRAEKRGSGFVPKDAPHPDASSQAKDCGIDIMAWRKEAFPPPSFFYYGQAASGRNWMAKPAYLSTATFEMYYMDNNATKPFPRHTATIIPFRITDDSILNEQLGSHKVILERIGMLKYAKIGLEIANSDIETDEAGNMCKVVTWIKEIRKVISENED